MVSALHWPAEMLGREARITNTRAQTSGWVQAHREGNECRLLEGILEGKMAYAKAEVEMVVS